MKTKLFLRQYRKYLNGWQKGLLIMVFPIFYSVCIQAQTTGTATVTSDKDDYAPRSVAIFTGSNFAPAETVLLRVKNLNQPCHTVSADSSYLPWTVVADAGGNFVTNWTVCDCPGDSLRLKATGQTSGLVAFAYFTDGNITFSTSGLPAGTPVSVNWSHTQGNGVSGSTNFNAPGPSSAIGVNNQSFTYSFPASVTISGVTYTLVSSSHTNPFNTGGGGAANNHNVIATYCQNPSIGSSPSNQTITYGTNATFSVSASGTSPGYQWQERINSGAAWAPVSNGGVYSGATTASLSVTRPGVAMQGYQYRVVVSGCSTSVTSAAATLSVSPKNLTVTGVLAVDKVYDGTSVATFNTGNAQLQGIAGTDNVTLNSGAASGVFASANAGSGIIVTASGFALGGNDAANYTLTQPSGLSADITKATAIVMLASLSQTYTGSALAASATTNPAGLQVDFTYDGSASGPTNAGTYAVVGSINNANYVGSASGTLVINKATASLILGNLNQTYTGSALTATATTVPSGLLVNLAYDGSSTAPVNAGSYAVTGTISDSNYEGSGSGTLVIAKATASLVLHNLSHVYDGTPKYATATTVPAGLTGISISNNGKTDAGTYVVTASLTNDNYSAPDEQGSLFIDKATATLSFADLSHVYDGSIKSATATTSPAGLTGVSISNNSHTEAGTYLVEASLTSDNYRAYPIQDNLFIDKATASISITNYSGTYDGVAHTATGIATGVGGTDLSSLLSFATSYTDAPGGPTNWNFTGGTNYYDANGTADVTIGKANAVISVVGYNDTYDGMAHGATGSATGVVSEDLSSLLNLGTTFTDAPGGNTSWTFAGNTNYNVDNGSVAITIGKADALISITDYSGTYDGASHTATGSATGVGGVDLSDSLSFATSYTDAPGGTTNWTFAGGNNYFDENGTATVTLGKANATIVVNGYTGTYDGMAHGVTGFVSGVNSENLSGLLNLGNSFTDAPGGTASWTFAGNGNYNQATGAASVLINKAVPAVTLSNLVQTYDGNGLPATATVTGVNNQSLSGTTALTYKYPGSSIFTATLPVYPGTYAVKANYPETTNYTAAEVTGSLVINLPVVSITAISAPLSPLNVSSATATLAATFDNNAPFTVVWDCGDGTVHTSSDCRGSNAHAHTFTTPGVYKIKCSVMLNSQTLAEKEYQYVVIYDPNGSFTTGGGWFVSPATAIINDLGGKLTKGVQDKAHFGFNSKYTKGKNIPDGSAQFQFTAGGLEFNSFANDWLVVSGGTAKYKGRGKIKNDTRDFGFMIFATDGEVNGKLNADKFRIKIWLGTDETNIVYDNAPGDDNLVSASTIIGGGSIVVHEPSKSGGGKRLAAGTEEKPETTAKQFYTYPNPFSDAATISFELKAGEKYELAVYDIRGALVKRLDSGQAEAGKVYEYQLEGRTLGEGIYFIRLVTESGVQTLKTTRKNF